MSRKRVAIDPVVIFVRRSSAAVVVPEPVAVEPEPVVPPRGWVGDLRGQIRGEFRQYGVVE
jgi:hypothetical protein